MRETTELQRHPTRFTLVRHGETTANVEGVWHGSTDTMLTARGRLQAERVALHLERTRPVARALYASPLERAQHTAQAIAARLDLKVETRDDLAEHHLGVWEGLPFHELEAQHRLFERMGAEPDWRPGGGETRREVGLRASRALTEIASCHPGARVIVVTHGGALALALGQFFREDAARWRETIENASVSELHFAPQPRLHAFNYTMHLQGLE